MRLKKLIFLLVLSACTHIQANTVSAGKADSSKAVLSDQPHLQTLLREEMRALQTAMSKLASALPQGDWLTLATTAKAMHDSFIFEQKLSPKDRDILHHHLPPEFIHLDQGFHQRASWLHKAAIAKDAELSLYHFSRLLDTCMQCHQRFATHRFPTLKENNTNASPH